MEVLIGEATCTSSTVQRENNYWEGVNMYHVAKHCSKGGGYFC